MNEDRRNQSRRDFLKIGAAAGLGAAVAGLGLEAKNAAASPGEARTQFKAPAVPTVKVGFVGVGGMGSAHVQNYLNIDGVEIKAICDIVPAHVERAQKWVVEAGQPKPAGYSNGRAGLRADVRDRGPRPGHDGHALGMARARVPCGHEERQARGDRGPRGHVPRGLLGPRRDGRKDQEALPDDGELLLRPDRAHDPEPRPQGRAGRGPPRRGRLSPRPPRRQVLEGRRGAVAAGLVPEAQRQPLSDPRPRARGPVHEHQPRRRLRLSRLDELARRGASTSTPWRRSARTRPRPRNAMSSATSTRA